MENGLEAGAEILWMLRSHLQGAIDLLRAGDPDAAW